MADSKLSEAEEIRSTITQTLLEAGAQHSIDDLDESLLALSSVVSSEKAGKGIEGAIRELIYLIESRIRGLEHHRTKAKDPNYIKKLDTHIKKAKSQIEEVKFTYGL